MKRLRHSPLRRLMQLEERALPATLFAIDSNGQSLRRFNSATPGIVSAPIPVTGLVPGAFLEGIDFRPATGQLFGLAVDDTSTATIGTINPATGAYSQIGAPFKVSGGDFGFDFNPTNDRIRITSDGEINFLVNPNDGVVTIQGALNPGNPNIVGSAYSNNFANATTTTLFDIDSNTDQLFQQVPATGALTLIGNLGVDTGGNVGFDIAGFDNTAYAALTVNGVSGLYSINLSFGFATLIGQIGGSASITINARGLAVQRFVWDGGGADPNWKTPQNWVGDVAPEDGDDLVFPAGAAQITTSNNDIGSGAVGFNSIVFTGNGYDIDGNGIVLFSGITDSAANGVNDFDLDIDLLGRTEVFGIGDATEVLALGGFIISDQNAKLNKEKIGATSGNAGTLRIDTSGGIFFKGTTSVNGGTLELATPPGVVAIGPLVIGDNTGGTGADVVRLLASNVIANQANVTVTQSGLLALDPGFSDTVNGLIVTGGIVTLGTGQLTAKNPSFDNTGQLRINLSNGNVAGKINGIGTVRIGGSLQLNGLAPLPTGSVFVVINNDGTDPIIGQFNGIAEGSQLNINGQIFTASYKGGDGNDFTLSSFNTVTGLVFEDHNGNGVQDTGDQGLPGATVFDDANLNNILDPGEQSTTSDAAGNWALSFSTNGSKSIRQVPPAGFVQSTANPAAINLSGGQTVTGINFGNFNTISISGIVFNDVNKNGVQDPGELGIPNVSVLLDIGANGTNDTFTKTNGSGNYSFNNLGPGTYRVSQVIPPGFVQTTVDPLVISAASGVDVAGVNFGDAFTAVVGPTSLFAVGAGVGCGPRVYVYNADNSIRFQFMAYDVSFEGEVRVATGDVNGDGVDDIITGAGPSGGPHVKVFSGVDRALLASFFAYDASFTGGLYVAAGDINGDGRDDIITGADAGGGPHVKVFDATTFACIRSFFAYSPAFNGGVRVAAGDVNGDETDDIITGAGPGGGPHVCVYSGSNLALLRSFYAYDPSFTGGVYVAAVDLSLDGTPDIATGAGSGGGPHVQIYNGLNLALIGTFFAYASNFTGGVRVGSADINADGRDDLLTSPGPGMISLIREFDYNRTLIGEFDAFIPMFLGGAYVG